jgi:hypothetical protein
MGILQCFGVVMCSLSRLCCELVIIFLNDLTENFFMKDFWLETNWVEISFMENFVGVSIY